MSRAQIHPVDRQVGKRIRQRRWVLDVTQQELAEAVEVKFQQIQKYETGQNRVSASRLWEISVALRVSPAYFFEGMDVGGMTEPAGPASKEEAQLLRLFGRLPTEQQEVMFKLMQSIADPGSM